MDDDDENGSKVANGGRHVAFLQLSHLERSFHCTVDGKKACVLWVWRKPIPTNGKNLVHQPPLIVVMVPMHSKKVCDNLHILSTDRLNKMLRKNRRCC